MRSHTATAVLEAGPPEGNAAVLRLAGRLDASSVATLWNSALAALSARASQPVVVDAAGLEYCDSAGVALLVDLLRQPRQAGAEVALRNVRESIERLLRQFDPKAFIEVPRRRSPREGRTERIGHVAVDILGEAYRRVEFIGEAAAAIAATVAHPLRLRWNDALVVAQRVGADAVPIILLVGFLLGVILAFQSAVAMGQFGTEIYVANLVALSMLRELGPLMTAIVLSGRSGSAFAAEIGTMKVNEEINALSTMGVNPVRFLVAPRILAGFVLCPLLTLICNIVGLLGGGLVMRSFGIPLVSYFRQASAAVGYTDLFGGLAKSLVFGLLVAGVGCMHGLKTGQGPSAVGLSTTNAVVGGIVLIIAADGMFAVIYHLLDI